METTMKQAMAMSAAGEHLHASLARRQHRSRRHLPLRAGDALCPSPASAVATLLLTDVRIAGVDAIAPLTGVVYPRLEAPPV